MIPRQLSCQTRGRRRSGTLAAAALVLLIALLGGGVSTAAPSQAPSNTSPPTVSGTARQGQTLTGTTGVWSGTPPVSLSFQWLRCDAGNPNLCTAVAGAASPTYVLKDDDVGRRMRLRVTGTNSQGSASALSAPTAVVVSTSAPLNTAEPAISGTARFGSTLTASTGSWSGATPMTFTFQWRRCDASGGASDGSNCPVIAGATGSTYVIASADVGQRLRVRVTATNGAGSATATSNATGVIPAVATRPVNTAPPVATGSYVQGQILRAVPGTWTGTGPISYTYRWLRCNSGGTGCVTIAGATGTEYLVRAADVGSTLRVQVTARNSLGSATATSGPTQVVVVPGPAPPAGVITLPTGERSIPVTSVPSDHRLVIDRVELSPSPVRTRNTTISVRIKVKDTRGYVVRDALVFLRSTPVVTTTPPIAATRQDGWIEYHVQPEPDFPIRNGYSVQFFVRAYRQGDPPLAGVAGYRLVQVATAR
jgi:hypothetical protein